MYDRTTCNYTEDSKAYNLAPEPGSEPSDLLPDHVRLTVKPLMDALLGIKVEANAVFSLPNEDILS